MKKLIPALILFLTAVNLSFGQSYMTENGTATFHSQVPMHTFSGTSDHLTGMINLDDGTVDFYLDLTTLETGISKRDRDMRETLETNKYPFAEFFGTLTSDFNPDSTGKQKAVVEGDFKIHGEEKETGFTGTLKLTSEGLLLKADWVLRLEDYNIEPPSLLFMKVDQEQKIEIEALLKPVED